MQWNWLVRTKLLLAALALVVLMGDSIAGPFANRRNNRQQGQYEMVDQGTTTTVQAQPTQPGQPTQPATVTTQVQPTQQQQGQYVTQRRGLFGRRSTQVWEPTPVVQASQPTQPLQPMPGAQPAVAAGQQPQPAAGEAAPMPSTTQAQPTVQATQPVDQQPINNGRRGLFGRRTARNNSTNYGPVSMTPDQQVQPGTTRQSFYPANGQTALIDVRVPVANAQVTFDGAATRQQGLTRLFTTPARNPQGANSYEVKATWTGPDGKPVEQTRTVKVPPGARVLVDFNVQQQ